MARPDAHNSPMHSEKPTPSEATEELRRRFDPIVDSVVAEVLAAVADATNVDLAEAVPLASVVEPDALEALFDPLVGAADTADCRVVFTYEGVSVTVRSEGLVSVAAPPTP